MEIDFRLTGNCKLLSNLYPHKFTFRGVDTHGIEPLLVAAKFPDPEEQMYIIQNLQSFEAMMYGKKQPWWERQELYWMGEAMDRDSVAYMVFVCRMYNDLYEQNEVARAALIDTGTEPLKHSFASNDPTRTVLTRDTFCFILTNIRAYYLSQSYVEY